jgi:hypothetical protein
MHPQCIAEAHQLLARWNTAPHLLGRYPLYTGYLQSLVSAERLNAVHRYIRPLIAQLRSELHAQRYELIHALCMAVDYTGRYAGTSPVPGMPHEFLEEIAIPTLIAQRTEKSEDPYAHLWLAMLPSQRTIGDIPDSVELLELAHQLAPSDAFIAERVAHDRLRGIWFVCHHLPQSLFAPADNVLRDIAQLRKLILVTRKEGQAALAKQVAQYEQQIQEFVLRTPITP